MKFVMALSGFSLGALLDDDSPTVPDAEVPKGDAPASGDPNGAQDDEPAAPGSSEDSESPVPSTEAPPAAPPAGSDPASDPPAPAPGGPERLNDPEAQERAPRDSIFDAGYGRRGQVTIAIGGMADALDPRAAAGASLRVPQFTSDARFGLGSGWSAILHLNTILAINELDFGVNWSFPIAGQLRGLAQFQTGISLGMLGSFGFESTVLAPEFRPLVGVSLHSGSLRWSLRGEVIFAGPYFANLGETSSTLATPPPIANWNIGIVLENHLRNSHLWYAGVLMMASTATYQNWLLFPDTSHYDYYPRIVGGYEF